VARDLTELTRIIRRIEAKARTANPLGSPRPAARQTLEAVLDGAVEETERGKLLVVRRRFPVDIATAPSRCSPRVTRRPRPWPC
jgi:hypothetical protein